MQYDTVITKQYTYYYINNLRKEKNNINYIYL
jgi:hypothetical protein